MERRDFMTSMGSLMALGTLSTPLVGHATTGGLTPGDLSEEGLDAYMDEVSAQIRRIEATRVDPEIKHHLRQRGMPARLTKDIARMMLVGSAMRDLPPELQEQPKVQRRLLREAPRITRTVMRLTDFLKGHTEEELQAIQKRFQEDPSLGEEAISHYTRWGDRHGLPPERREQTRSFMESATWQFTHQPPSLALRECTDKVDRVCASAGFRQEDWEAHLEVVSSEKESLLDGSGPFRRTREAGKVSDWEFGTCLPIHQGDSAVETLKRADTCVTLGGIFFLSGSILGIVGMANSGSGLGDAMLFAGGVGCVVGMGLFFLSMLLIVGAAFKWAME